MAKDKNQTGPQPVPLVQFDSDEQMNTVVAALMLHHKEHGEQAVVHEQSVARLDEQIAELKTRLDGLMAERLREDAAARQRREAEDGIARTVAATGAPRPKRVEQLPGAAVWRDPYGPQPVEAQAAAAVHEQGWNGQTPPQTGMWAVPDPQDPTQAKVNALMAPPPPGSPPERNSVWDDVERGGGA